MNKKLTGRGGAGRGQGRKPSLVSHAMPNVSIKMTDEQHAKLSRLGGAPWVRAKIDAEREPGSEKEVS